MQTSVKVSHTDIQTNYSSRKKEGNHDIQDQWKKELADSITSPQLLLSKLSLDSELASSVLNNPAFKLRVPLHFVTKMKIGDRSDPLLKQVLPTVDETVESGMEDPVGDLSSMPSPGLHHKYHGRALIITTGACAVNCRYCFRRHYPYEQANTKNAHLAETLNYLKQNREIKEIILSGGDPLTLDDKKISYILRELELIPNIKWLRVHTRLPIMLPSRITDSLLELFSNSRFRTTFVIHTNHANELSSAEFRVFEKIRQNDILLLNQSVLLKGINDNADDLIKLSEKLYDYGVLPYYLHCFDPVRGAMHFDVNRQTAIALVDEIRNRLPGLLVPKLVKEELGKPSKTAIFSI